MSQHALCEMAFGTGEFWGFSVSIHTVYGYSGKKGYLLVKAFLSGHKVNQQRWLQEMGSSDTKGGDLDFSDPTSAVYDDCNVIHVNSR